MDTKSEKTIAWFAKYSDKAVFLSTFAFVLVGGVITVLWQDRGMFVWLFCLSFTIKGSAIRAFVQQKKTLPSDSLKPVIAAALPTSSAGRHEPAFSSFESEHRPSVCLARRSVQSAIWV